MQEILTAVTYLVSWLICERVIGIENGLVNLLISLGAAVGVYLLMAFKEDGIITKRKKINDHAAIYEKNIGGGQEDIRMADYGCCLHPDTAAGPDDQ